MSKGKTREEFEEWCEAERLDYTPNRRLSPRREDYYDSKTVQTAWEAWNGSQKVERNRPPMAEEECRAKFEAWAVPQGYHIRSGNIYGYHHVATSAAWKCWKAIKMEGV